MRYPETGHDKAWVRIQLEIEVDADSNPLYYKERLSLGQQEWRVKEALKRYFADEQLRAEGGSPVTSRMYGATRIRNAKRTRVVDTHASTPAPVSVAVVPGSTDPDTSSPSSSEPGSEVPETAADGAAAETRASWSFTLS